MLPAESATVRALIGPTAAWSTEAHLLALVHDAVTAGNWQRQGKANVPKPRPLPRPGVDDPGRSKIGGGSYDPDDFQQRLAAARQAAAAQAELEGEVTDGR